MITRYLRARYWDAVCLAEHMAARHDPHYQRTTRLLFTPRDLLRPYRSITPVVRHTPQPTTGSAALFPPPGHAQVPYLYGPDHNDRLNRACKSPRAMAEDDLSSCANQRLRGP